MFASLLPFIPWLKPRGFLARFGKQLWRLVAEAWSIQLLVSMLLLLVLLTLLIGSIWCGPPSSPDPTIARAGFLV